LFFFFLVDSPRNLILQNKENEAFQILYKFKERNFFDPQTKLKIINEIKEGENLNNNSNYTNSSASLFSEIFNSKYFIFTFCVGFNLFATNMLNDGFALITNLILKNVNFANNNTNPMENLLDSNLIFYSASLLSCLVYGVLSEIEIFGRKKTIFTGLLLMSITIFISFFFLAKLTIFFSIISFLNNVNNLILIYGAEVYHTKIRDMAVGCIFSFAYLGSALSQYIFIYFLKISNSAPLYLMFGLSLLSAIIICISPYETYGKPLDSQLNSDVTTKKMKPITMIL
jgi:MFS family permease